MWVRGLKRHKDDENSRYCIVAPRVGAWIETAYSEEGFVWEVSHLVWVRGLKQLCLGDIRFD